MNGWREGRHYIRIKVWLRGSILVIFVNEESLSKPFFKRGGGVWLLGFPESHLVAWG